MLIIIHTYKYKYMYRYICISFWIDASRTSATSVAIMAQATWVLCLFGSRATPLPVEDGRPRYRYRPCTTGASLLEDTEAQRCKVPQKFEE